MSDVEVFQLKKDNHIVTFKLFEGFGIHDKKMEVGVGFVGENHMFAPFPIEQARNMWKNKVYEGYRQYP